MPKSIVPLLNVPFLAYQLDLLRRHGVTDVVLSCSHMVDEVRRAMGDGAAHGVRLRYAVEIEPLGTGGGVRNAIDLVGGLVLVLNGDILTDADLSAMLRFHAARAAAATIDLFPVADPTPYGLVELGDAGRVLRFIEKPDPSQVTAKTINAGIYVLDPTVNIVDPCVIGRGSRLEAGCRVGPAAVVGEHCVVGRGAQVAGAVLWDRVSVADGAMLSDCIVASGARVGAGAVIGPGVVLEPNRVVPDRARLTA